MLCPIVEMQADAAYSGRDSGSRLIRISLYVDFFSRDGSNPGLKMKTWVAKDQHLIFRA